MTSAVVSCIGTSGSTSRSAGSTVPAISVGFPSVRITSFTISVSAGSCSAGTYSSGKMGSSRERWWLLATTPTMVIHSIVPWFQQHGSCLRPGYARPGRLRHRPVDYDRAQSADLVAAVELAAFVGRDTHRREVVRPHQAVDRALADVGLACAWFRLPRSRGAVLRMTSTGKPSANDTACTPGNCVACSCNPRSRPASARPRHLAAAWVPAGDGVRPTLSGSRALPGPSGRYPGSTVASRCKLLSSHPAPVSNTS